jgi:predicted transcriptional regulator
MNDTEIKAKLFQQIDKLKNERLIELYCVVSNFINSSDNSEEWDKLTSAQKTGIEYGLKELENGKWEEHNVVMEKLRKKYSIS